MLAFAAFISLFWSAVAGGVFGAGHLRGLVLLGVAPRRGGAVRAWAGLLLAVSQVLHLLFAIVVPVHALDAARGLTIIGCAAAATAA